MSARNARKVGFNQHAEYAEALWVPHSHFWPGRSRKQIRYVIIHSTPMAGATAQTVAKSYQSSKRKQGPHYIVGRLGDVVQCVQEEDSAYANGSIGSGHQFWWGSRGNPNLETLSVEFVKSHGDRSDSITAAQVEAGFRLISYLVRKWGIPPRLADAAGGITGHFSIDPLNYNGCPGPFPWDDLFFQLVAPADGPISPLSYQATRYANPYTPANNPATLARGQRLRLHGAYDEVAEATESQLQAAHNERAAEARAAQQAESRTISRRTHQALSDAPGFASIIRAADTREAFQGLSIKTLSDIAGWFAANGLALLLRLILIGLGIALIIALVWSLVRRNSWMKGAGADLLPLAFANLSATGDGGGAGGGE